MHLTRTRTTLALAALLVGALAAAVLLRPTPRTAPGACTAFASPTGTGSACTEAAPCQVASWWVMARPGGVLCLLDGAYRGTSNMIAPPETLAGTAAAPITVRALHDGQVLLDAEHQRVAVNLHSQNDYFVIEGLNAKNGGEYLYLFGGNHTRGRRLIGWDGTQGQANSYIFATGRYTDNRIEDCAGWGDNSRKIFDGAQSLAPESKSAWSGYTRCWGEFNGWPNGGSNPTATYQIGYHTRQQRYENILGTWNTLGATGSAEGVVTQFYDCNDASLSMAGTTILGGLFYVLPGQAFSPSSLLSSNCTSDVVWRDVVAVLPPGFSGKYPMSFINQTTPQATPANNRCENCVSVYGDGNPARVQNTSGWTLPGLREARTLDEATGGRSVYELLPGLCHRYEHGVLTTQPLWPWPMQQRILDASRAAGRAEVDVQAQVEAVLGVIPDACRADRQPPVPPQPPGSVALTCTGTIGAVPGAVQMTCVPQTRR